MVDYAIVQDMTQYGIDVMQSNPEVANHMVIQTDAHTKIVTNNNYGISGVYLDLEGGLAWNDLEPLTLNAQMQMREASLGLPSVGFWDTIKQIMAYAIPVGAGIIAGAIAGGLVGSAVPVIGTVVGAFIGGIAGAFIGLGISAFSYGTQKIELEQNKVDIKQQLTDMLGDGTITAEEYQNAVDSVDSGMEEPGGIPWTTIIIGGMVGVGALAALYIFMKTRK